jgi:tyrosinase
VKRKLQWYEVSHVAVLAPFHSDNGSTIFTSDDVRSTSIFGYSYPELPDWEMDSDQLAANVRYAVNTLYSPSSNGSVRRSMVKASARSASIAETFGGVSLELAQQLDVNNRNRQWSIAVLVDRFPVDTSFCIDFFMGEAPDDVSAWPTAANLIGTYAQFNPANVTMIHPDGFPKGQVHGEISMTHTLAAGISRGALRDLSPRSVVPLLRKALNWRARTPDGEEVPATALSGLTVSVATRPVVPRTADDEFPQYGAVQWIDAITEGKPGGAGEQHKQT